MREIKYRAWDNYESKMIYSDMENHDYDFKCDENGNMVCFAKRDTDEPTDYWVKIKNIMQYTGLKDSEGNKIYEGDIYKWTSQDVDGTWLVVYSIVVFDDGAYWGKDSKGRGREPLRECITFNDSYEKVELAGNKYENADLLEVE